MIALSWSTVLAVAVLAIVAGFFLGRGLEAIRPDVRMMAGRFMQVFSAKRRDRGFYAFLLVALVIAGAAVSCALGELDCRADGGTRSAGRCVQVATP